MLPCIYSLVGANGVEFDANGTELSQATLFPQSRSYPCGDSAMPDFSPSMIYDSLDDRRLALFVGARVAENRRSIFYCQLARFVLQSGVAALVVPSLDPRLLQCFDELGARVNQVVNDADLETMQPDRPTIFSLAGSERELSSHSGSVSGLAEAANRRHAGTFLRQALSGKVLLCYGVDPNDDDAIPSVSGWPGADPSQPIIIVWEGDASQAKRSATGGDLTIVARDPFDLLGERMAHALPDQDHAKGLDDDIAFNVDGADAPAVDAPPTLPPSGVREETLRIDARAPERVVLNEAFVLAVAVRQPGSPVLWEGDLSVLKSGEAQVVFAGEGPIRLRLRLSAPDCRLDGPDTFSFRLSPGKDSPTFYFNLTPVRIGSINIVIQLFQEDDFLGGARLATQVDHAPAGQVQMFVQSQPVALPSADARRQIEQKARQLQEAQIRLANLEGNLALLPPGSERANLQTEIDLLGSLILQTEREIDELMQPSG